MTKWDAMKGQKNKRQMSPAPYRLQNCRAAYALHVYDRDELNTV